MAQAPTHKKGSQPAQMNATVVIPAAAAAAPPAAAAAPAAPANVVENQSIQGTLTITAANRGGHGHPPEWVRLTCAVPPRFRARNNANFTRVMNLHIARNGIPLYIPHTLNVTLTGTRSHDRNTLAWLVTDIR